MRSASKGSARSKSKEVAEATASTPKASSGRERQRRLSLNSGQPFVGRQSSTGSRQPSKEESRSSSKGHTSSRVRAASGRPGARAQAPKEKDQAHLPIRRRRRSLSGPASAGRENGAESDSSDSSALSTPDLTPTSAEAVREAQQFREAMNRRQIYSSTKSLIKKRDAQAVQAWRRSPLEHLRGVVAAVLTAVRTVLVTGKVIGTFWSVSYEKKLQTKLQALTRRHLYDRDWSKLCQSLETLVTDAVELEGTHCDDDGLKDVRQRVQSTVESLKKEIAAKRELRNCLDRLKKFDGGAKHAQKAWKDLMRAHELAEEVQQQAMQLHKELIALGMPRNAKGGNDSDSDDEFGEDNNEEDDEVKELLEILDQDLKARLVRRLSMAKPEEEPEELCRSELEPLGATPSEFQTIVMAIRKEAWKESVTNAMGNLLQHASYYSVSKHSRKAARVLEKKFAEDKPAEFEATKLRHQQTGLSVISTIGSVEGDPPGLSPEKTQVFMSPAASPDIAIAEEAEVGSEKLQSGLATGEEPSDKLTESPPEIPSSALIEAQPSIGGDAEVNAAAPQEVLELDQALGIPEVRVNENPEPEASKTSNTEQEETQNLDGEEEKEEPAKLVAEGDAPVEEPPPLQEEAINNSQEDIEAAADDIAEDTGEDQIETQQEGVSASAEEAEEPAATAAKDLPTEHLEEETQAPELDPAAAAAAAAAAAVAALMQEGYLPPVEQAAYQAAAAEEGLQEAAPEGTEEQGPSLSEPADPAEAEQELETAEARPEKEQETPTKDESEESVGASAADVDATVQRPEPEGDAVEQAEEKVEREEVLEEQKEPGEQQAEEPEQVAEAPTEEPNLSPEVQDETTQQLLRSASETQVAAARGSLPRPSVAAASDAMLSNSPEGAPSAPSVSPPVSLPTTKRVLRRASRPFVPPTNWSLLAEPDGTASAPPTNAAEAEAGEEVLEKPPGSPDDVDARRMEPDPSLRALGEHLVKEQESNEVGDGSRIATALLELRGMVAKRWGSVKHGAKFLASCGGEVGGTTRISVATLHTELSEDGYPRSLGEVCCLFLALGVPCSVQATLSKTDFLKMRDIEVQVKKHAKSAKRAEVVLSALQLLRITLRTFAPPEVLLAQVYVGFFRERGEVPMDTKPTLEEALEGLRTCLRAGRAIAPVAEVLSSRLGLRVLAVVITSNAVDKRLRMLALAILSQAIAAKGGPICEVRHVADQDFLDASQLKHNSELRGVLSYPEEAQSPPRSARTASGSRWRPQPAGSSSSSFGNGAAATDILSMQSLRFSDHLALEFWHPIFVVMDAADGMERMELDADLLELLFLVYRQAHLVDSLAGQQCKELQAPLEEIVMQLFHCSRSSEGKLVELKRILAAVNFLEDMHSSVSATITGREVHRLATALGGHRFLAEVLGGLSEEERRDPVAIDASALLKKWRVEREKLLFRWRPPTKRMDVIAKMRAIARAVADAAAEGFDQVWPSAVAVGDLSPLHQEASAVGGATWSWSGMHKSAGQSIEQDVLLRLANRWERARSPDVAAKERHLDGILDPGVLPKLPRKLHSTGSASARGPRSPRIRCHWKVDEKSDFDLWRKFRPAGHRSTSSRDMSQFQASAESSSMKFKMPQPSIPVVLPGET